jgi:V8-like Glu-specific endopeptidase
MKTRKKSLSGYTLEELYREIIVRETRGCCTFKDDEGKTKATSFSMRIIPLWDKDDRLDWYEIDDEKAKGQTQCVAAILKKKDVVDQENGYSKLKTRPLKDIFNIPPLCENVRFREQPTACGRILTGFLVKNNVIATAGHFTGAMDTGNPEDLRFVFGYKMLDKDTPVIDIPNKDIYKGKKILHLANSNGLDYALLELDRPVNGQRVATLSRGTITKNEPLYVIGYPMGLPLKYAPNGKVTDNNNRLDFTTDLDVFLNNSGSPVFNLKHEVIGVVITADKQTFKLIPIPENGNQCRIYVVCPDDGDVCIGPRCIRVSTFIDLVDKL